MSHELFDACARIDKIIWLKAAGIHDEAPSDDLKEFIEDDIPTEPDAHLFTMLPCLKPFAEQEDRLDVLEVMDALSRSRADGFLFQAATPVYHYYKGGDGASLSWGHHYTAWLYTAKAEDMERMTVEWAAERHKADKQKAA